MNAVPRISPSGPGFLLNLWHAAGLAFWHILFQVLNRVEIIHP